MSENCPLLSLTRKPLIYSTFEFGGDDMLGFYQGYLPKDSQLFEERVDISKRYKDAKNDPTTQKQIEDEYESYEVRVRDAVRDTLLEENKQKFMNKLMKKFKQASHNEQQRLRIVDALGGEEFCKTIPIIQVQKLSSYPHFNVNNFPEGHSLAQYEDPAGRKGILMKLKNKETGQFEVAWFNQRYRETCIGSNKGFFETGSGDLWMGGGGCDLEGVDKIITFISQVKPQPHKLYKFVD